MPTATMLISETLRSVLKRLNFERKCGAVSAKNKKMTMATATAPRRGGGGCVAAVRPRHPRSAASPRYRRPWARRAASACVAMASAAWGPPSIARRRRLGADDQLDDLVGRRFGAPPHADDAAVAEHEDAVGDREDVAHIVADDDARRCRSPCRLQDEVEHLARFLDAERGGRLVHDDDAAVLRGGAADRDRLALAARELARPRRRARDMDTEVGEDPPRALAHRLAVDEPAPARPARGRERGLPATSRRSTSARFWKTVAMPSSRALCGSVMPDRRSGDPDLALVGLVHARSGS